jgi:hypothetical protein
MVSPRYASIPTDAEAKLVRKRHPITRIMEIRALQKKFIDRKYQYETPTSWIFVLRDFFLVIDFPPSCGRSVLYYPFRGLSHFVVSAGDKKKVWPVLREFPGRQFYKLP